MFSNRQQQIIESAIKIIANNGIQKLTTKKLAEEIGISEPALYRHFNNKLSIMKAIIKYFQIKMQPAIIELNSEIDSIQKIKNFFYEHLRIMNCNPQFAKVIFSEANFRYDEDLISKMNNMMTRSQNLLESTIQTGQQSNEIISDITPLTLSRLIIGPLRLLITQWSMSGMIFDLEAEGRQLCEDILKLIVKV